MTVAILVPYRPGGDRRREQLWRFVRGWLDRHHGWPVITAAGPDGPFNRSAAINQAARLSDADVFVIHDADTFTPRHQLERAAAAARNGRLVAAFTWVAELDPACTDVLLQRGVRAVGLHNLGVERVRTAPLQTQSSALAVPRTLFDRVGGFNEQFVGWGAEDNAFWRCCQLVAGEPARIPGPAYHLWHPPSHPGSDDLQYRANQRLWRRYINANNARQLATIPGQGGAARVAT